MALAAVAEVESERRCIGNVGGFSHFKKLMRKRRLLLRWGQSLIRNNWALLRCGYLFRTSSYRRHEQNDGVEVLEVWDRVMEYIV